MHGDPLTPTLAGGDPEQSTATRVRERIQSQRAMREPAVEIDDVAMTAIWVSVKAISGTIHQ